MPSDLLSFCLRATFNVLPCPSNLKCWHSITTEPYCSLCHKSPCTTAHILSGCKVALTQGRYVYRHDNVLAVLANQLQSFIKTIKPTPPKLNNSVPFVKEGTHVTNCKSNPTGLLHLANDWIMDADLSSAYKFPSHIAETSQRPDIYLYSNSLKRVILIELTCPCEENFNERHQEKLDRYIPLVAIIKSNSWIPSLFCIEVGARGYCSRTVITLLRSLGLPPKRSKLAIKDLGYVSTRASFNIWLSRDCSEWNAVAFVTFKKPVSSHHNIGSPPVKSNTAAPTKDGSMKSRNTKNVSRKIQYGSVHSKCCHPGFYNKGNTCYANSILQAISAFPDLWSQGISNRLNPSSLTRSISSVMSQMQRSSSTIDPSNFLRVLQSTISNTKPNFQYNTQHDVTEVLEIVLAELTGPSNLARDLISLTICYTKTCNECYFSYKTYETQTILVLPVGKSVQSSLDSYFKRRRIRWSK